MHVDLTHPLLFLSRFLQNRILIYHHVFEKNQQGTMRGVRKGYYYYYYLRARDDGRDHHCGGGRDETFAATGDPPFTRRVSCRAMMISAETVITGFCLS